MKNHTLSRKVDFPFVALPVAVIDALAQHRAPGSVWAVYTLLWRYANSKFECWPSQATIAAELGTIPKRVSESVAWLVEHDLIEVERRDGNHAIYHLLRFKGTRIPEKRDSESRNSGNQNPGKTGFSIRELDISKLEVSKLNTPTPTNSPSIPGGIPSDGDDGNDKQELAPDGLPWPPGLSAEDWSRWKTYRSEIRHSLKPSTEKMQMKWLRGKENPAQFIERAILHGWQGLCFESKSGPKPHQNGVSNGTSWEDAYNLVHPEGCR